MQGCNLCLLRCSICCQRRSSILGSYRRSLIGDNGPGEQEAKRGLGAAAVFIARNRFAVLDKGSGQIQIKNLRNEITKKVSAPLPTTDAIFYAGTGTLLCRSEDKVPSNLR